MANLPNLANYVPGLRDALGIGIYTGSGAPTHKASKGSLYVNLSGSSSSDRIYVNTDGSTTWTSITTAA